MLTSPTISKKSAVATDLLGNAITALESLKDASNAVSAAPCLGAVFAGALGLLKTIEVHARTRFCERVYTDKKSAESE